MARIPAPSKTVETLTREGATRKNIPTAEYQSVLDEQTKNPVRVAYERGVAGLEASPAGSSTPTTTRKASSSATPTSWARTIPTSP